MRQQVLDRCKQVVEKAKELYGMDLSQVQISFNLRGRAAGKAGGRGWRMPGSAYYVKFNHDMLTREAAETVLNDVVPHEYAHVVCFMDPSKGKNHDAGWARVCRELGGTGGRTHSEKVVYGKGTTYEYTTDRGHKVRLSDKRHRYVQAGGSLRYKHNKGIVTMACAYSIVGHQGRTLEQPIVRQVATPYQTEMTHRVALMEYLRARQQQVAPQAPVVQPVVQRVQQVQAGESKAATSRRIMLSGYQAGHSYETIIAAMIAANGYDRQLARGTFKANAAKVGIPSSFYA
jgi:predicted SprT family Zn-dependent metalloprotease